MLPTVPLHIKWLRNDGTGDHQWTQVICARKKGQVTGAKNTRLPIEKMMVEL
jgi:hypothetical protein